MKKTKKDLEMEIKNYRDTLESLKRILESNEIFHEHNVFAWGVMEQKVNGRLEHPDYKCGEYDEIEWIIKNDTYTKKEEN